MGRSRFKKPFRKIYKIKKFMNLNKKMYRQFHIKDIQLIVHEDWLKTLKNCVNYIDIMYNNDKDSYIVCEYDILSVKCWYKVKRKFSYQEANRILKLSKI